MKNEKQKTVTVGPVTAASLRKRATEQVALAEAEREKKMREVFNQRVEQTMNDILGCCKRDAECGKFVSYVMRDSTKTNNDIAMEVCARLRGEPYLLDATFDTEEETFVVKWSE